RARRELRALCDAVNYPSTKARQLIDDIATGHAYFGLDGYLPAFSELTPLLDYFPASAPIVFEDPAAVVRALRAEIDAGRAGEAARTGTPQFPFERLYVELDELDRLLAERSLLALHRGAVAGPRAVSVLEALEAPPPDAPSLGVRDQSDLGHAVKATRTQKGKARALDPLLQRLALWREAGLSVTITARTRTQAERVAALLGHRGVTVELVDGALAGDGSAEAVRVAVAPLTRGAIAVADGFVLVTEEEIFGQRPHRAPARQTTARSFLADLRAP